MKPDTCCRCSRLGPSFPCTAPVTQEDLLCDECRNRDTHTAHLGTPQHQTLRSRPGFPGER